MIDDEASPLGAPREGAFQDADLAFDRSGRPKKAATAFRTISEVADDLHVPQHVLRFWETRFPQVKPLKRGGGRRYYRPEDVVLLRRISDLLYVQGYTIKGVQRLLLESGGTLQGELSPPDIADRDDQSPHLQPEHLQPGHSPLQPVQTSADDRITAGEAAPPADCPAPSPDQPPPVGAARELDALRRLLGEILSELESVRRQLAP